MARNQSDDAANSGSSIEVCVYRSERRADTYVYVPVADEFESLPEEFRDHFGPATAFLNFELNEQKVLAQADATKVMASIRKQGFFLQLPPADSTHSNQVDD